MPGSFSEFRHQSGCVRYQQRHLPACSTHPVHIPTHVTHEAETPCWCGIHAWYHVRSYSLFPPNVSTDLNGLLAPLPALSGPLPTASSSAMRRIQHGSKCQSSYSMPPKSRPVSSPAACQSSPHSFATLHLTVSNIRLCHTSSYQGLPLVAFGGHADPSSQTTISYIKMEF